MSGRPRGQQAPLPQWFVPANSEDSRPKSFFTIMVDGGGDGPVKVNAVLMSDSGSCAGLTIPARKAIEMGLAPGTGKSATMTARGAGNESFTKIRMVPSVKLEVEFFRSDGTSDTREIGTFAWCHKIEYNECLRHDQQLKESRDAEQPLPAAARDPSTMPSRTSSGASASPLSPTSSSGRKLAGTVPLKQISLITHRSERNPNDRATIGMEVLKSMGIHINCETSELEIEEEVIIYED